MDDDHDLVADIDSDILIKMVKFLRRGKAPGPDNIHNKKHLTCCTFAQEVGLAKLSYLLLQSDCLSSVRDV